MDLDFYKLLPTAVKSNVLSVVSADNNSQCYSNQYRILNKFFAVNEKRIGVN